MAFRPSTLQVALLISAALHGGVLALRFADPVDFNRLFESESLDVVLVNARSQEAPEKAQAIAQASLAGGGEAESGRATTPLPPSATTQVGDDAEDAHRQIQQLQQEQEQLLAQLRQAAQLPPADPQHPGGSPDERAEQERHQQRLRLLAEIEKRIQEENARPKKRFISPATREQADALYYDQLRRKIEDEGTRHFPQAHGRKLYGELTMMITVDRKGRVVEAQVVLPSRSRALDRQAAAIVRAAGPYGAVSEAMRRRGGDLFVFTSRFTFSRERGFETTLSVPDAQASGAAAAPSPAH
jgi:protein TonB